MKLNAIKLSALLLMSVPACEATAQLLIHNQYPCAECAVFDNNGTDLRGFINSNKSSLLSRGNKVNEFSNNTWGYVQVKNIKVPSTNKEGNLNYYEAMDVTLALHKTDESADATWIARETNAQQGPLVYLKTNDEGKLGLENTKYTKVAKELESKKFTLVEYFNDTYSDRDYDVLFHNYIVLKSGTIKDASGLKAVIDFYDNFLSKFVYVNDPVLGNRSFVTFFSANDTKYIAWFNIVNGKLAGHLDVFNVQYERERPVLVNDVFKKLKGNVVYIYGEETFGLDKDIVNYSREHSIKIKYKKTTSSKKFNEDK